MLIHVRGLKIHAQSGKGGVVNLVVGTDQKHTGVLGRLRQHLANALFRAGDLCHPSNHHDPVRVVRLGVGTGAVNDALPHRADTDGIEVLPLNLPNGDAYYNALLIHESVKGHQKRRWLTVLSGRWGQKGADDSCGQLLSPVIQSRELANVTNVLVIPDNDSHPHSRARH